MDHPWYASAAGTVFLCTRPSLAAGDAPPITAKVRLPSGTDNPLQPEIGWGATTIQAADNNDPKAENNLFILLGGFQLSGGGLGCSCEVVGTPNANGPKIAEPCRQQPWPKPGNSRIYCAALADSFYVLPMSTITTYDSRVAARTRCADQILRNRELLDLYQEHGGLPADLTEIRDHGRRAEALNQARSGAKAQGGGLTLAVLEQFTELQREYTALMAVVVATRRDLAQDGATATLLQAIDQIIKNEAPVLLRPEKKPAADGTKDGKPAKKRAVRSQSQESIRAEIYKDAVALLELKEAQPALARRRINAMRLKKLRDAAEALTGLLGERDTKKGAGKAATQALRDAVQKQKEVWGACYRILSAVGQEDQRVRSLLTEAASKR